MGKQLKIKTSTCTRTIKDVTYSGKEKDEHDVRKQEEVLAEYLGGRKYELDKLVEYADQLEAYLAECAQDADTQTQLDPTEELRAAKKALTDARAIVTAGAGA